MTWLEHVDIRLPPEAAGLGARRRAELREEARRELLHRAQRGITIYPLFFGVLGVGTEAAVDHPWPYFTLLALAVVLLGVRVIIARTLKHLDAESVPLFQMYLVLGWISSTALTGFIAALVLWYGDRPVVYIGELGMTGISAGIIGVMSIHRQLARTWAFSGVLPLAICNLWVGSSLAYSMAAMLVLYVAMSMPVLDRANEMYWRAQIGGALLDQRAQETARLARWAGMAEIAASVLHDVGNVLNSVRISAQTVEERLHSRHGRDLAALVALMRAHPDDLAGFLRDDDKGKLVLPYLERLATHLDREQTDARGELERLGRHLDHIATVVSRQQEYAKGGRTSVSCAVEQLAYDAVELVAADYSRLGIEVAIDVETRGTALVDVHQTLQVLVNLLTNARDAVVDLPRPQCVRVRVAVDFEGRPIISVRDEGCGITAAAADKLFTHGFTTKARGHGFGLHHSFLVAKAMGGRLEFASAGVGTGATFTLTLPRVMQDLRTPLPTVAQAIAQARAS
jgi:signal transduction histidine kinase